MKENVVMVKSMDFSVRIVRLYNYLCEQKHEYVMSKQLLRCGTSIGANLSEAQYAQSKKDFVSKANISLKEAAETIYWLELLNKTNYLDETEFNSISNNAKELLKLLISIVKTTKGNIG